MKSLADLLFIKTKGQFNDTKQEWLAKYQSYISKFDSLPIYEQQIWSVLASSKLLAKKVDTAKFLADLKNIQIIDFQDVADWREATNRIVKNYEDWVYLLQSYQFKGQLPSDDDLRRFSTQF